MTLVVTTGQSLLSLLIGWAVKRVQGLSTPQVTPE